MLARTEFWKYLNRSYEVSIWLHGFFRELWILGTNSTNFEWYATFNKTVERIISACNKHVFADNLH